MKKDQFKIYLHYACKNNGTHYNFDLIKKNNEFISDNGTRYFIDTCGECNSLVMILLDRFYQQRDIEKIKGVNKRLSEVLKQYNKEFDYKDQKFYFENKETFNEFKGSQESSNGSIIILTDEGILKRVYGTLTQLNSDIITGIGSNLERILSNKSINVVLEPLKITS